MEKRSLPMMFLILLFGMLLTVSCSDVETEPETEDIQETADGEATITTDDLGNTYQKRTP